MHNTQKIGTFWRNIPRNEDREFCLICGAPETMEHILIYCENDTVNTIWEAAKEVWPSGYPPWPEINLGIVLGCGSVAVPTTPQPEDRMARRTSPKKGATRLLRILLSESAHLIWVLRCERVIQEKNHTKEEITARWLKEINKRLTDDKIIATRIKRDNTTKQKVTHTWEDVLKRTQALPKRWLYDREVLVGMRGRGPGRRNP
jgi:hypothetical protein